MHPLPGYYSLQSVYDISNNVLGGIDSIANPAVHISYPLTSPTRIFNQQILPVYCNIIEGEGVGVDCWVPLCVCGGWGEC